MVTNHCILLYRAKCIHTYYICMLTQVFHRDVLCHSHLAFLNATWNRAVYRNLSRLARQSGLAHWGWRQIFILFRIEYAAKFSTLCWPVAYHFYAVGPTNKRVNFLLEICVSIASADFQVCVLLFLGFYLFMFWCGDRYPSRDGRYAHKGTVKPVVTGLFRCW